MIVDGTDLVLGRMATNLSKKLLEGKRIQVVNAEKVIITGKKEAVMEKFLRRTELKTKGNPLNGPRFHKKPDKLVRNAIKGMLPKKRKQGKEALKNLEVFIGVPEELTGQKFESIREALNHSENFIRIGEISKTLGKSW